MLEKDEKTISEKEDGQIEGYWTTESHIDLMNDIGEFFSLTDVQECADDPSSIVQLEDSDTTRSNEESLIISTSNEGTNSYVDLDAGALSTPPSEGSSTTEWPPFIPLQSSTIQIHGNEIRHSPKQPTEVNSEEPVQVQVPPLRVPIIRRLEDTSKENPRGNNRGKKSLENLQRKTLKKKGEGKDACKPKGIKRQYKRGRNLENEFEGGPSSQPVPTVTIHHHADPGSVQSQSGIPNQPMQDSQMKSQFSQAYGNQVYRDAPLSSQGPGNADQEPFDKSNDQRGPSGHISFNQRAQMIPDPRSHWSDKSVPNRNNVQPPPNVCVNSNGMFSRMDFHEVSGRGYSMDGSGSSSSSNSTTRSSNENHRRMFHNNPERFEPMWPTTSLSPVERLFRNRISEVNEVRQRCGDSQKFMKNSQLYKQLLAPIKDEAVKSCEKGSEFENMMTDVKKSSQFNAAQSGGHRYDLPNEWTKVPSVPKPILSDPMRSADSKPMFESSNYINFNESIRRAFPPESMMTGNPYDHVSEINEHFSKNENLHNSEREGVSSTKQLHLPNWLKPHTISKDYETMFMEILKLRFCIYSERARNEILQAENLNLRRLMNLQRNLQAKDWPISSKNPSTSENMGNGSGGVGHGTYYRGEESMEHRLNPGVNSLHQNDIMFDPNCVSNTFGQLTRENLQRNGHLQSGNNVYYNGGPDCISNVAQHQQRQPHNFGVLNMMRR